MSLKKVHLTLACDADTPVGSDRHGYEFVAPLQADGHIDPAAWRKHQADCRVRRFWHGQDDKLGHLVHTRGRRWAFHYDLEGAGDDDETGYRFESHVFKRGEYVSIHEHDGQLRTFKVEAVRDYRNGAGRPEESARTQRRARKQPRSGLMAIKDILLHLDQSPSCGERIRLCLALAGARDAHVTGLYPTLEPQWPAELHSHLAAEVLEQRRQETREAGQRVVRDFTTQALEANISAEGLVVPCLEIELAAALVRQARCADLLVLGQAEPGQPLSTPPHSVESVIMASGCASLMVPYVGYAGEPGKRVMVAWDGGRESARSIKDAMPFLSSAESVALLMVDAKGKAALNGEEPGTDLARHLARHGCRVEVQCVESGNISIGDTILSRLADQAIDLLVMGAYGHARMRELILGGVTRHIMRHMTVPVLLSH